MSEKFPFCNPCAKDGKCEKQDHPVTVIAPCSGCGILGTVEIPEMEWSILIYDGTLSVYCDQCKRSEKAELNKSLHKCKKG